MQAAITLAQSTRTCARQGRSAQPSPSTAPAARGGSLLTWVFTAFNSLRIVAYLPTLWAIGASGNSNQHSLLTWAIFLGSNATMALWLFEQNRQRINRAAFVTCVNSVMCLAICVLIGGMRLNAATA